MFMIMFYMCLLILTTLYLNQYAEAKWIPCSKDKDKIESIDGDLYDCCKGNKTVKQKDQKCCFGDGQFYFESNAVCCGEKLVRRQAGVSQSCCNDNTIINDSTHICCGQKILELPAGTSRENASCCGQETYDLTKKFCCKHSLSDKVEGLGCCGAEVIDTDTTWCDKHGVKRLKYRRQCGQEEIDLRKKYCCKDKVIDVPFVNPHNMKEKNAELDCCGSSLYNKSTDICCSQKHIITKHPFLKCCGQTGAINIKTQLCCNGVHHKKQNGFSCCGDQTYDGRTHQCCNGKVFANGLKCCGSRTLLAGHVCCKGTLQINKKHDDDDACCVKYIKSEMQSTPYNHIKAICCQGTVYHASNARRQLRCCGRKPFNIDEQLCCQENVINVPSKTNKCCGPQSAVPFSENCHDINSQHMDNETSIAMESQSLTDNNGVGSNIPLLPPISMACLCIIASLLTY